jgi:DNA primase
MFLTDSKAARSELRRQLDIVKVVADDLGPPVKQSGSDNFYCCPFHGETKPSFSTHQQMQIWHCFGCTKGGDIVSWIQNYHGLSTNEAIIYLATTYNINLSAYLRPPTQEEIDKERYIQICEEAVKFFSRSLLSNKQMYDWYVSDTGFNLDQIVTYDVGYSNSADDLVQHLFTQIKGLTQDDIVRLEFNNKFQWSNALVYPIRDASGTIARFYTKPLSQTADGGKYLGTSHNHPLFTHKLLFGFSTLKKDLRKTTYSVRVNEGFKAAIASNGVAVMGTQIHEQQIQLLKEYGVKEIRVAFDGDSAGRAASIRLLNSLNIYSGINVLVVNIPEDKQPDGIRKEYGEEALNVLYSMAVLPVQFYVDLKRDTNHNLTLENKFSLVTELREHLVNIPDIQLDLTAKYLGEVLGVDPNSIKEYVIDIKLTDTGLFNRDAEQTVLQHVMLNPKSWSSLKQAVLDTKVFTGSSHQYLFITLDTAHKKARENEVPDSVTVQVVRDEMKIGYPQWPDIHKIIDSILSIQSKYEFTDALQRIVDLYRRRQGIDQSKMLQATLQDLAKPTNDIISKHRRDLVSSIEVKRDDTSTPPTLADAIRKEIEERSLKKSAIIGYDFTNLVDIDGKVITCMPMTCLAMSGLQKNHEIVVSGNTGAGKSLFGLQLATSISVCPALADQIPVLWIPLEMSPVEIGMRQVSMLTGINNKKVQSGMLNVSEQSRVNKALDMIAKSQFFMKQARSGTIDEIFSIIDEYHFKYGIMGVISDYIQLIAAGDSDKGVSREQVISRASKVLKFQVAEGLHIFSVAISQQNRANYEAGNPGKVESVGGSYTIVQDADDVLLLAEKTPEQMAESKNGSNRRSYLDKKRGGTSDIYIDYELDVSKDVSLRWNEIANASLLLGLSKGTGI